MVIGGVLAVVLAGAAVGIYQVAQWWHERGIEDRVGRYEGLIRKHAEAGALPLELVRAVVRAESGGDPKAVSPKGAKGLMQIMPVAERDVLERLDREAGDLFDPDYNLWIGCTYLGQLAERFDRKWYLVIAAYHMGPTAVARLQRDHPALSPRQLIERYAGPATKAYCRTVLDDART